jgi:hypothetical protein
MFRTSVAIALVLAWTGCITHHHPAHVGGGGAGADAARWLTEGDEVTPDRRKPALPRPGKRPIAPGESVPAEVLDRADQAGEDCPQGTGAACPGDPKNPPTPNGK